MCWKRLETRDLDHKLIRKQFFRGNKSSESFIHKLTCNQAFFFFFLNQLSLSLKHFSDGFDRQAPSTTDDQNRETQSRLLFHQKIKIYFVFQSYALVVVSCLHGDDGFLPSFRRF